MIEQLNRIVAHLDRTQVYVRKYLVPTFSWINSCLSTKMNTLSLQKQHKPKKLLCLKRMPSLCLVFSQAIYENPHCSPHCPHSLNLGQKSNWDTKTVTPLNKILFVFQESQFINNALLAYEKKSNSFHADSIGTL